MIHSQRLRDARIVVIGAGAIGSVAAYRLAQAGASVTIIERRFPGSGTTGNSFAWLNSFNKTPRDYHRLNVRSIGDHLDLARELDGSWAHVDGGLTWTHQTDERGLNTLRETARRLHRWGYRIEIVNAEQAMEELEPDLCLDPELVGEVYYTPGEGWINGVGLSHGATHAAIHRYGARFVQDDVVDISVRSGVVESIKLASGGELELDAVVNAAGPGGARIAALASIDLPVQPQPGMLLVTEPAPVALKHVVHAPEGAIHSDGGWRLLLQRQDYDVLADPEKPISVEDPLCENAISRMVAILPGLRGIRVRDVRIGIRAMPQDGLPIIGFDPDVEGFYHLIMHSGVTLSAAVGLLATDDFLSIETPELEPYRPERFAEIRKPTSIGSMA